MKTNLPGFQKCIIRIFVMRFCLWCKSAVVLQCIFEIRLWRYYQEILLKRMFGNFAQKPVVCLLRSFDSVLNPKNVPWYYYGGKRSFVEHSRCYIEDQYWETVRYAREKVTCTWWLCYKSFINFNSSNSPANSKTFKYFSIYFQINFWIWKVSIFLYQINFQSLTSIRFDAKTNQII